VYPAFDGEDATPSDNYFDLPPGEPVTVDVSVFAGNLRAKRM